MKLAQHEAAAPRQRLSLSASKKRALEAAFDAESTPGLEERKRIAAAVDITPRQVQVWFQNRRQRTRGGTSRQPSPRTSKPAPPRTTAVPTRSAAVSKAAPPAEAPTSAPQVPAVSSARPSPAAVESAAVPARPSRPPASSSKGPSPPVLEALMGFLCHQLELQAMDLWFCGSGHMELRQVYAPEGASVLSQLLWCRAVLSTQLLDAVSAQGRAVWFGASPEQASLLSRAGGGKAVIGVPCPESPAACAAVGPPTRPSSGGVAGVLLLYCSHALDRTPQLAHLLSAFGSAVAAATAAAPAGAVPRRGYSLHPVEAEASGPGWLLLAAALAADAEAAEHWLLKPHPPGERRPRGHPPAAREQDAHEPEAHARAERRLVSPMVAGSGAEARSRSPGICRAALRDGELVWLHAAALTGGGTRAASSSDGLGGRPDGQPKAVAALPHAPATALSSSTATAIGLPLGSSSALSSAFALYSPSRLQQCPRTTNLLLHLPLLHSAALACKSVATSRRQPNLPQPNLPQPGPLPPPAAPRIGGGGPLAGDPSPPSRCPSMNSVDGDDSDLALLPAALGAAIADPGSDPCAEELARAGCESSIASMTDRALGDGDGGELVSTEQMLGLLEGAFAPSGGAPTLQQLCAAGDCGCGVIPLETGERRARASAPPLARPLADIPESLPLTRSDSSSSPVGSALEL